MTDEVTPTPEVEDTPAQETETPAEDTSTAPVVDYEQRYNNLRPEFDRTKQQLKEYEEYIQSLQAQEQEPEQDDEDDEDYEYEYEDPVARREVAELKAFLANQQEETLQAQQQAQETDYIENSIVELEAEFGEEFSDEEFDWLGHRAAALKDEDGRPDTRRAYEQFNKMLEGRKSKWVETKKSPKVNSGPTAAEIPDLDSPRKRAEYMDQKMADAESEF